MENKEHKENKEQKEKEIYNEFAKRLDYRKFRWIGTGRRHQKTIIRKTMNKIHIYDNGDEREATFTDAKGLYLNIPCINWVYINRNENGFYLSMDSFCKKDNSGQAQIPFKGDLICSINNRKSDKDIVITYTEAMLMELLEEELEGEWNKDGKYTIDNNNWSHNLSYDLMGKRADIQDEDCGYVAPALTESEEKYLEKLRNGDIKHNVYCIDFNDYGK